MGKIGTKEVKTGGGFMSKTILPGEHVLKINSIELVRYPFMEKDKGYFLTLNMETKPIDGFEGFLIDKDSGEDGPRYAGQIGQIKTNRYFYKDGKTKSGIDVVRDVDILKQLKDICIATDSLEWFESVDNKFDTIEELIEDLNKVKPFEGVYLRVCVAGKEFERNNGYIGHDLFLPKYNRGFVSIEPENAEPSKLTKYNEAEHLEKKAVETVKNFGDESDLPDLTEGAPEFDI